MTRSRTSARSPTTSKSISSTSAPSTRRLGDLLQHVVVRTHDDAAAGLAFARERAAGRVGFLVAGESPADAVRALIADVHIVGTREEARAYALETGKTAATPDGEVFRGAHRVEGGARGEARSILTTKREIKELRERAECIDDATCRGCATKPAISTWRSPRPSRRSHRSRASCTARKRRSSASICR